MNEHIIENAPAKADLFFGLELNLGIESAGGSEEHGLYRCFQLIFFIILLISVQFNPLSNILERERHNSQLTISYKSYIHGIKNISKE